MTDIDGAVGARIRALRLAREMTQEDLARRIGVQFQQVQKYEKGANRVSASRLFLIAEALSVPVEQLFAGVGAQQVPEASPFTDAPSMEIAFRYAQLSPPQKVAVLSLVRSLTENIA